MFSSDLPGVNLATLNGVILYYRLMTKWSGLGDSTELSWMGLSQSPLSLSWRLRGGRGVGGWRAWAPMEIPPLSA
jgi:hypothetical protein